MQVGSSFAHLVAYNTTIKIEFKMNIIWMRWNILKFFTIQDDVVDDVRRMLMWHVLIGWWCGIDACQEKSHSGSHNVDHNSQIKDN
jgi:hypothetical protein